MEPRQIFRAYELSDDDAEVGRLKYCPFCGTPLANTVGQAREVCPTCDWKSYRNPAPAVSVLLVEQNRFLLVRRRADAFQGGKWCLPCGYVEFNEDYLTAAIREAREETGLDVEVTALLSAVSNFLTPVVHTIVIVLLAKPVGGELRAGDDAEKAQWFLASESLPEMAFEADSHIIGRYFETRLPGAPIDPRYRARTASRYGIG